MAHRSVLDVLSWDGRLNDGDGVFESLRNGISQDGAQDLTDGFTDLVIDAVLNILIGIDLVDNVLEARVLAEVSGSSASWDVQEVAGLAQNAIAGAQGVEVLELLGEGGSGESTVDDVIVGVEVLLAVVDISGEGSVEDGLESSTGSSCAVAWWASSINTESVGDWGGDKGGDDSGWDSGDALAADLGGGLDEMDAVIAPLVGNAVSQSTFSAGEVTVHDYTQHKLPCG